MRLASFRAARPTTVHHIRGPLAAVMASAILLVAAIGPIAAATPAKSIGAWSKMPARVATKHRIASAKVAARAAVGNPRSSAARSLPTLRYKNGRSSKLGPESFVNGTKASSPKPRIVSGPDVVVAQQFAGLAEVESGDFEPPDPWVAVSGSYVVQVVNSIARMSNRQGAEISSIPTWALFALTADQSASDARIIWDATHARWVGISLSFNELLTDNHLNLAVSDGADPTAGWTTFSIPYGDFLPDYPSIASSSDKIVITDNAFDSDGFFFAADMITITWSSVLGGAFLTGNECINPDVINQRAAQVLSAAADVHLIMEASAPGNEQWYQRVRGAGDCTTGVVDTTDLGSAFTAPPNPRQSPSDTIGTDPFPALDERPTDAVWQNGALWWVSTIPVSYDGDATRNDGVAIWRSTTASFGSPTAATSQVISAGDGIDDFYGGIGLTRNGTLVTVYSESSSSDFVSMKANQIAPGLSLGTPVNLDVGEASYGGERWGDFAGVAMDPVGTGAVWATHQVAASDGTWRTDVVRLVADNDSPSIPGTPTAKLLTPTGLLGISVPVRLSWAPATDASSGIVTYQITANIDGTGFFDISNVASTSTVRQLLIGHTYQFAIRAVDAVGTPGSGSVGPVLHPYLYQQTTSTSYGGTWSSQSNSVYSGGSVKYASTAGRSATFTATSARSIAFITTKSKSRGSFKVYVDGVYKAKISTYSLTAKYRQVVYSFSWATPGTHKIKIVVVGTLHHPRVDVDAFVVLR